MQGVEELSTTIVELLKYRETALASQDQPPDGGSAASTTNGNPLPQAHASKCRNVGLHPNATNDRPLSI